MGLLVYRKLLEHIYREHVCSQRVWIGCTQLQLKSVIGVSVFTEGFISLYYFPHLQAVINAVHLFLTVKAAVFTLISFA
jgi:hypothetical protein